MPTPENQLRPIRVLIVDDSALARQVLSRSLAPFFPHIQVVGTALDPYVARDKILELQPDVLTLDIEMPRMDGLTFLRLIMKHRPMPVIILSSLTAAGSAKALEALQAGAVEVMEKPGGACSAPAEGTRLAEKIKAAACARLRRPAEPLSATASTRSAPVSGAATSESIRRQESSQPLGLAQSSAAEDGRAPGVPTLPVPRAKPARRPFPARKLVLLGASTGGTEALKTVLTSVRGELPGICIVQHIPAYFSKAFADRLNQICPMEVREAQPGDVVRPGLALVAPGGSHLLLKWRGSRYEVELNQGPWVHHQRPAVDILFDSALKAGAGPHVVAALLTGMGADGAAGLARLRAAGARTIAQNEETCVVFGMPREAIRLGAAQHVLPLEQIGPRLEQLCEAGAAGPACSPTRTSEPL